MRNRNGILLGLLSLGWFGWVCAAGAAVLVQYPFTGSTYAPATVADNLSAGDFSYTGTGTIGFNSTSVTTDSGAPAVTGSHMRDAERTSYLHFTVTPDPGWYLSITEVTFWRYGFGGGDLDVSYVIDGVETFVAEGLSLDNTYRSIQVSIALSDVSDPVHFRFYARNMSSLPSTLRMDDVTLFGDLRQIPEPGTVVLLAAGMLWVWRLRRPFLRKEES